MVVSNSAGKNRLSYEDVMDLVLGEEVSKKDASETSGSGAALNLEEKGRGHESNSGKDRSKSRKGRSKSKFRRQPECWNCGKTGHYKKNCIELKKKKTDDNSVNIVVTKEVQDALLLCVDCLWTLGFWTQELPFIRQRSMKFLKTILLEILGRYTWLTDRHWILWAWVMFT
jgi:hypothetical protein